MKAPPLSATCAFVVLMVLEIAQSVTAAPPAMPKTAVNYYSAQKTGFPPLPFNPFPELPLFEADQPNFIYDDREVDYKKLLSEAPPSLVAAALPEQPAAVEQLEGCASELLIKKGSNSITLTITNASVGKVFDLFRAFELSGTGVTNSITNSFWYWVTNGSNGQSFTFSNGPCDRVFYVLGCTNDSDADGLTDAYEVLVNKTSPTTNNTLGGPFNDYQGVNVLVNDPEQDCETEKDTQDETTLIASSNLVIAAWVDTNRGRTGYGELSNSEYCGPSCGFSINCPPVTNAVEFIGWGVSKDGGRTFTDRGPPPMLSNVWALVSSNGSSPHTFAFTNLGNAGDPVLAYDTNSNVSYLTGNPQRPSVYYPDGTNQPGKLWVPVWRSTNGGDSFSGPVNGASGITPEHSNEIGDGPTIIVDNYPGTGQGYAYLAFARINSTNRPITICRSTNGTDWMVLTNFGVGGSGLHQICIRPNHEVCLVWRQTTTTCPYTLFFSKSPVGGTNFSAPLQVSCVHTSGLNLTRSASSPADDAFRAPAVPRFLANPVSGDLYYVYHDIPASGTGRPNIYLIQSTNGGANWDSPRQVNTETNSTPTDQWQPALAVKPDGTKLFIAWYDRRDDPTNHSLIQVYGTFANLPLSTNLGANFLISTVAFPPVFTGTNQVTGNYDPTYPNDFPLEDPRDCEDFGGNFNNHMGDYDTAVADSTYVFYTWSDKRNPSRFPLPMRRQADIRLVRLPWPP